MNTIYLKNDFGMHKEVDLGFNWLALLFGWIPTIIKGYPKTAGKQFLIGLANSVGGYIGLIILAFIFIMMGEVGYILLPIAAIIWFLSMFIVHWYIIPKNVNKWCLREAIGSGFYPVEKNHLDFIAKSGYISSMQYDYIISKYDKIKEEEEIKIRNSKIEKIRDLKELLSEGVITEEEYKVEHKKIVSL